MSKATLQAILEILLWIVNVQMAKTAPGWQRKRDRLYEIAKEEGIDLPAGWEL